MEELKKLARKYYKETINLKYFGIKGGVFILLSLPLMLLSISLIFKHNADRSSAISISIATFLWFFAKLQYDKNLIIHLSKFTQIDSKDIRVHKAYYLSSITGHISPSLFETLKIFKEIFETERKNKSFVLDNVGYYFSKFIYDPDSKNRILSLAIYLISLIAILTVVKHDTDYNIYDLIASLSFRDIVTYLSICFVLIIFGYFTVMIPLMFVTTYIITPLFLKISNVYYLNKFFIVELNKYAFLEEK